ncbi:MAG: PQQ-dependent sugar dehydrogenase [Thermoplasmatota archaeon]
MRAKPWLIAAAVFVGVLLVLAGWLFGIFQPDIDPAPTGGPDLALVPVADGFSRPVQVVEGPSGLTVVEQGGRIKTIDGQVLLDLDGDVSSGYEQGLLAALWHEGHWYTHHTDPQGDTVLSRWSGNQQTVLWTHPQPYSNHNGGMIAIGPDGMLWMGLGDGGAAADPEGNGQDTSTHLGGILRFDISGDTVQAPDNPFAAEYLAHYGLRNPWRFSFDMATGDLWIGDVGQGNVEEISVAPAGAMGLNFGWNVWEGENRFRPGTAEGHIRPVAQYDHDGGHCSVTGGHVIRDGSALDGVYVFGDFCSGQLWTVSDNGFHRAQDTDLRISSFGQDTDGTVYLVDHGGAILRVAVPSA